MENARPEDGALKRRASTADDDEAFTKRRRYSGVDDINGDSNSRRDSSKDRESHSRASAERPQERQRPNQQEEKRRNKRLFGGLLTTLSQKSTNTHEKRRQEIERKQKERLEKQREEDDVKRSERTAKLRKERQDQQVHFDERVMRARHSKMLAMARFLKTKAEPPLVSRLEADTHRTQLMQSKYYLPGKITPAQEDMISEQIRDARAAVDKELEAFDQRMGSEKTLFHYEASFSKAGDSQATRVKEEPEEKPQVPSHRLDADHHDESSDVLVEADEDNVLY